MKVAFFSNFLNHHQYPFCVEMMKLLGEDNFVFISTEPMPESFKATGYPEYLDAKFHLRSFLSKDNMERAKEIGFQADVTIIGSADNIFIKERLEANKVTFYYHERWFKKNIFKSNFIKILYYRWLNHARYRNKNLFMLCASAFQAGDCRKVSAYPNKTFKWGYFTQVPELNIEQILEKKRDKPIKIFWCARMLEWKHPELAILLAEKLKEKGCSFELEMVGIGDVFDKMKEIIDCKNLHDRVTLAGLCKNTAVIEKMKESHIFLFTSDRNEGWGAVLNEAMSSGCACVASDKIGSAPFLIEDGVNGFLFESGNLLSLVSKCEKLINDRDLIEQMSINAYQIMQNIWNPKNAADSFISLAKSILDGEIRPKNEGPCSRA